MNPLYETMPTSVFERMSLLAADHGAINLGQGFPDFGWPEAILETAATAVLEQSNQYAPSRGLPDLRRAIADHYNRHFGQQLDSDWICVTSGATEALASSIFAATEPGDEVIIFAPAYDCYAPTIRRAGGVVREIKLQPPHWRIERDALRDAINPRTRAILFNNPQNPTGRLFDRSELEIIAEAATAHDLLVISDEVWEHIVFGASAFTPLASLPGMADRTIKVGSAGKIFSLTGWKIGWIVASPALAALTAKAHQFLTFSTAPNLQRAVAFGLAEGDGWIDPMRDGFERAYCLLRDGLKQARFAVLEPASTYFACVDLAASGIALGDEAFAQMAVREAGVAVIPISAFVEQDPPTHLVRLCFAKRNETIAAGVERMATAREIALSR